jgi:hypothetical protein
LADLVVYGSPYLSFYTYSLYNVFSGLGSKNYGVQSALEYFSFFWGYWFWGQNKFMLPIGVLLSFGVLNSFRQVRKEPFIWGLLVYLLGHLWIGHKEPRFMAPIFWPVAWVGILGSLDWFLKTGIRVKWIFSLCFILQFLTVGLKNLVGQSFVLEGNYFEISRHLEKVKPCAVLTARRPLGFLFPEFPVGSTFAFGFLGDYKNGKIIWIEQEPKCSPEDRLLLQIRRVERELDAKGCVLQDTGILRTPLALFKSTILEKGLLSAPWYDCPFEIATGFQNQEKRQILIDHIPRLSLIPGINASAEQVQALVPQFTDGTLGDY